MKTGLTDKQIAELSAKITDNVREILVTDHVWPLFGDQALATLVDRQVNKIISEYMAS